MSKIRRMSKIREKVHQWTKPRDLRKVVHDWCDRKEGEQEE